MKCYRIIKEPVNLVSFLAALLSGGIGCRIILFETDQYYELFYFDLKTKRFTSRKTIAISGDHFIEELDIDPVEAYRQCTSWLGESYNVFQNNCITKEKKLLCC